MLSIVLITPTESVFRQWKNEHDWRKVYPVWSAAAARCGYIAVAQGYANDFLDQALGNFQILSFHHNRATNVVDWQEPFCVLRGANISDITNNSLKHKSLIRLQRGDATTTGPSVAGLRLSPVLSVDGSPIYYRRDRFGLLRYIEATTGGENVTRRISIQARRIGRLSNHVGTTNVLGTFTLRKLRTRVFRGNLLVCPTDRVVGITMASFNATSGAPETVASWTIDTSDTPRTGILNIEQVITRLDKSSVNRLSLRVTESGLLGDVEELGKTMVELFEPALNESAEFQPFLRRFVSSARDGGGLIRTPLLQILAQEDLGAPAASGGVHVLSARGRELSARGVLKIVLKALIAGAVDASEFIVGASGLPAGTKAVATGWLGAVGAVLSELVDRVVGDDPSSNSTETTEPPQSSSQTGDNSSSDEGRWDDPAPAWGDGSAPDPSDKSQGNESDRDGETEESNDREGGCFVSGTLVATPAGNRCIDTFSAGDEVIAFDSRTRTPCVRKVLRTFSHADREVLVIHFNDEHIVCTPLHRFWTGSWTEARALRPGDTVLQRNGSVKQIRSVSDGGKRCDVFNLSVEKDHTYFVGRAELLVHNVKMNDPDELRED